MKNYKYKVWNDGERCEVDCFFSVHDGDRYIVLQEFIPPKLFYCLFRSSNKLIENSLKRGHEMAKQKIEILKANDILNDI